MLLGLAVVLLLAFDWNRIKPWINTRVSEASGRSFAIEGELSLSWHAAEGETGLRKWVPWPRLNAQQVRFGNPKWATQPRMAEVQQVRFSLNLLALLDRKILIPTLALEEPRLTLERLQDGRSNWTFDSKGDSGWQLELHRLILNKGSVQLNDAVKRANLRIDIDSLAEGSRDGGYRIGWKMDGRFNDEPVSGNGRAGSVLSLKDAKVRFPIDARVRVGRTMIEAEGILDQPYTLRALDLQLKVSGASMADLYPLTGMVLPDTRAFTTAGRLVGTPNRRGGNWSYENFIGKMGNSDMAGTLHYRSRERKPLLEGSVVSKRLDFNDLAPLIGAGDKTAQPANRVFPVKTFRNDRWNRIDADVKFNGRKVVRKQELPVENVASRIRLQDGVLSLSPLTFGVAGGSVEADIRLDGNSKVVTADMKMAARHLKLKQLFPALKSMDASLGEINGDAALSGSGNSIAALLGSANGEFKAVINQGTLSKLLLERMGLNLSSIVVTQLFGDSQVQLNCAAVDFGVTKGVMEARLFVVDTDDAIIHVTGNADLGSERLTLVVHPDAKGIRLISLRSPLYVTGPFKQPEVNADKGVLAFKAGSALALSALAPFVAALIPLINLGPGEASECATLIAQASGKPVAPGTKGKD